MPKPALPLHAEGPALPALQALSPAELSALAEIDIADARKLVALVHRGESLPQRSPVEVRRSALDRVRALTSLPELRVLSRTPSAVDPFVKYALGTTDGVIETVRIPLERPGRMSVCVSSQIGCGLACSFCATGRMGLVRNLKAWEIVDQVRVVRRDLARERDATSAGARVHGVVFQGMGEALANWHEVRKAAAILSEPAAQAIDARNITISTAGLPTGIRALAETLPNVRLALSIGSALPGVRRTLIPIDAVHPLDTVLDAVGEHVAATRNVPLFAYTLLAGKNDSIEDARALARLIKDFAEKSGKRPRLSLIPYNSIGPGDPYERTDAATEERFREALIAERVIPTRRYSGGADVAAACGQLGAAVLPPSTDRSMGS